MAPSRFVSAILRVLFLISPRSHPQTNINPDTVYIFPHRHSLPCCLDCYYQVVNMYISNRLGGSVHTCATPCKIHTHFDISPSSTTALTYYRTFSRSFLRSLHLSFLWFLFISHSFFHNNNPILHTYCCVVGFLYIHLERNCTLLVPRLSFLRLSCLRCAHGLSTQVGTVWPKPCLPFASLVFLLHIRSHYMVQNTTKSFAYYYYYYCA